MLPKEKAELPIRLPPTVTPLMEVILNHNKINLENASSLTALLQVQNLSDKKGIAVAVNNKVVPRSKWNEHVLNADDSITIIKATQGG